MWPWRREVKGHNVFYMRACGFISHTARGRRPMRRPPPYSKRSTFSTVCMTPGIGLISGERRFGKQLVGRQGKGSREVAFWIDRLID